MDKVMRTLLLMVLLFSVFSFTSRAGDYLLGPRDVLQIGVWGVEELQVKDITVRDDGKIAFPLTGEIAVSGLSPNELANKIADGLQGYINHPKVTVNVTRFRTNRLYVLGEVNRPGLYEMDRQCRLLDAIGMAGGYTKDAAKKKVFIIPNDSTHKTVEANLLQLLQKGDLTQNYALSDGDVVYLTDNGRIDFARDVLPFVNTALFVKSVNKD